MADETPPMTESASVYPRPILERPLVLYVGMLEIDGNTASVGLNADDAGQPINVAPSIFYGIFDRLMVGIVLEHGLCDGCGSAFDDFGVHGRYFLIPTGGIHLAIESGLDVSSIEHGASAIPLSAIIQFLACDKMDILFIPALSIGITNRDGLNKELLELDALIRFQPDEALTLFLHAFYRGVLDPDVGSFTDTTSGGLGLGATYAISNRLDLGGEFDLTTLFNKDGSADGRQVVVRLALRFGN
jgi:hypothetical protein